MSDGKKEIPTPTPPLSDPKPIWENNPEPFTKRMPGISPVDPWPQPGDDTTKENE